MAVKEARDEFQVASGYQPLMREIGLDAQAVFEHPQIKVWRSIAERENCTLDAERDGREIRLHIKRYRAVRGKRTPAEEEVAGIGLLVERGIATVPLVGWGRLADGRSFVISEDLKGFEAADKLIERGVAFEKLLELTADLAAKLHEAGLHHRDLYLCHFFAKVGDEEVELRLIDAARVRVLPRWLSRRWVVKDLAQFTYSARQVKVPEEQLANWRMRYTSQRKLEEASGSLFASVDRKTNAIARHDLKLNQSQPARNVSIPTTR